MTYVLFAFAAILALWGGYLLVTDDTFAAIDVGSILFVGAAVVTALAALAQSVARLARSLEQRPAAMTLPHTAETLPVRAPLVPAPSPAPAPAAVTPPPATAPLPEKKAEAPAPVAPPVVPPAAVVPVAPETSATPPVVAPPASTRFSPLPPRTPEARPEPKPEPEPSPAPAPVIVPRPVVPARGSAPEPPKSPFLARATGLFGTSAPVSVSRPDPAPEAKEPLVDEGEGKIDADEPERLLVREGELNGMFYRFYSDGSVEAEGEDGIETFASITELRSVILSRRTEAETEDEAWGAESYAEDEAREADEPYTDHEQDEHSQSADDPVDPWERHLASLRLRDERPSSSSYLEDDEAENKKASDTPSVSPEEDRWATTLRSLLSRNDDTGKT